MRASGRRLQQLLARDVEMRHQADNRRGVNSTFLAFMYSPNAAAFSSPTRQTAYWCPDASHLRLLHAAARHPGGVVVVFLQACDVIFQRYIPAAARMPDWRIPPPVIFRTELHV